MFWFDYGCNLTGLIECVADVPVNALGQCYLGVLKPA